MNNLVKGAVKAWSDPVVEDLTVDLDAIASNGKNAGDANAGNPNKNLNTTPS